MKAAVQDCPKCGFHYREPFEECPRCGIVVWRFAAESIPDPLGSLSSPPTTDPVSRPGGSGTHRLVDRLLVQRSTPSGIGVVGRLLLWCVLVVWGAVLMATPIASNGVGDSFLHLVNLPFHEAGHLLFSPFGRFVTSLGGTLGQLLIPLACGLVLLFRQREPFSAAVCLWWFGENFLDMAPYIADARAGVLPLLGGNFGHSAPYGFHDWEFLLNETGLLAYDQTLAKAAALFGGFLMLLSLAWGASLLVRFYRSRRRALD